MRQPVRSFAIGLFTAGVIMLIGFYLFDTSSKQAENLTADSMIPLIEEEGYHVMTEEEYISVSVKKDNASKKNASEENKVPEKEDKVAEVNKEADKNKDVDKDKDKKKDNASDKEKNEDNKDDIAKFTINIESGMLSSTISETLKENKIIDDAQKFNSYLKKHDYDLKVQLGKFKVNSEMTFNEIAETISK